MHIFMNFYKSIWHHILKGLQYVNVKIVTRMKIIPTTLHLESYHKSFEMAKLSKLKNVHTEWIRQDTWESLDVYLRNSSNLPDYDKGKSFHECSFWS